MLICVITVPNICVCTYIYEYLFLVHIWTFYMASLNLRNTCKGHITLLPAVHLASKYICEGDRGWQGGKVPLCSLVAGNRSRSSKQSEGLESKLLTDLSGLGSALLW
jgi:hypothetical protein